MTPEQLGAMTLADAEALAGRLEAAARTIREAMALMGGGMPVAGQPAPFLTTSEASHGHPATIAAMRATGPVMTNKGPLALTAEEQARKAALRAERLAELPDNIRALEEANPE